MLLFLCPCYQRDTALDLKGWVSWSTFIFMMMSNMTSSQLSLVYCFTLVSRQQWLSDNDQMFFLFNVTAFCSSLSIRISSHSVAAFFIFLHYYSVDCGICFLCSFLPSHWFPLFFIFLFQERCLAGAVLQPDTQTALLATDVWCFTARWEWTNTYL